MLSSKGSTDRSITAAANGTAPENHIVKYLTPFPMTGEEVQSGGITYRLGTKMDCLAFRNFADSLDDFTLQYDNPNECIVWSKKKPGEPMRLIKLFGIFHEISPNKMYDMLQDAVYREVWDNYRIDAFRITKLDDNNDIGYYAVKSPVPGVSNRDFVNQRTWINAGGGEYVIFNTSVPHRDVPLDYLKANGISTASVVRAVSKITGYLIRPWTDESGKQGSCLTYVTQCDPGGWIPTSLTNYISTKFAPNNLKTLAEAAAQFVEWLSKQKDYVKDWPDLEEPYGVPVQHLTIEFAKEHWGFKNKRSKVP